ncbi:MAG: hypothetical protein AB7R55_20685, partial [Gemmatimonadales bacterium]
MRLVARAPALLASLLLATPAITTAQGPTGLLIVAHGADSLWNQGVLETTAQVRWGEGPKATAFLMGPSARARGGSDGVRCVVARGAARGGVV